jgi:ligand-binding SRPBCC domain-containing protein
VSLHRFEARQTVPIGLDTAWSFFSSPRNLGAIAPPWLGFELTCDAPDEMYAGLILTHRVRPLLGIPMAWVTEITHVQPRAYFIDEQRLGPYRFWHHQHHFREVPGGVEMHDIVHFAVPGGPLGDLVATRSVGPKVREIFRYRRKALVERWGRLGA